MSDLWTRKSTLCCICRSSSWPSQGWKRLARFFQDCKVWERVGLLRQSRFWVKQSFLDLTSSKLQVPMWAEVYEAFPPRYEPRWDAKDPEVPVRKILYREDSVRAQYSKVSSRCSTNTCMYKNRRYLVTMNGLICFPTQNLEASALLKISSQSMIAGMWLPSRFENNSLLENH